ncbi:MAG TPA: SUMF1/EgtB/PvdO family nonheme iron enzyme [Candidatus Dormibacteraeota bacterium]|nr:SUMF1/EgtB/PvdO family nonheme iron enzyme [Candidatus Dormibacteraeota bacterium]
MIGSAKSVEKHSLFRRLDEARWQTDRLFEIVRSHALYERPIPERHRLIFYLGHLEAFDWNLFRQQRPSLKSFHPSFDQLFAFGIDPVHGGLPTDRPEDWPSVTEVMRYNAKARQEIDALLEADGLEWAEGTTSIAGESLLHVAIEHRLMHAETLAYVFHRLPYTQKLSQPQPVVVTQAFRPEMVAIPAGRATLGLSHQQADAFGWDNEFASHQADVPEFLIDKFMVTNGEYLQFVLAGGYEDRKLWKEADWQWIESQQNRHPAFWLNHDTAWTWRGMFEEVPLPLDWPVYVSHAEASAYAQWAHKSLPSEAQWHRAAYGNPSGTERAYPWGSDEGFGGKGNFHFFRWDPSPANAFAENVSAFGVAGQSGNGWEWTSSEFAPFAGFVPFSFYPGYSANFFDGQHYVLKGGSARTAAPLLRRSFRNWFQPHYQYVYAGFRCVSGGGKEKPQQW